MEIGLQRLATGVAWVRENVDPRRLNMSNWFDLSRGDAGYRLPYSESYEPHCGTVACMLGWMCLCPALQEEGLRPHGWQPAYEGMTGFWAAEAFFGLKFSEARRMFTEHVDEETLEEVCDRIEAFIESRRVPQAV